MNTLSEAGKSVERRGFLDGDQAEEFQNPILMAQVARLNEEVGEFSRSLRSQFGASISELADVAIVCAAIANHLGFDLDAAVADKCKRDESERGYQHSGKPAPDLQVNGTKPEPDYTLKIFENGDRQTETVTTNEQAGYCYKDLI